jgi:hypothetical protein
VLVGGRDRVLGTQALLGLWVPIVGAVTVAITSPAYSSIGLARVLPRGLPAGGQLHAPPELHMAGVMRKDRTRHAGPTPPGGHHAHPTSGGIHANDAEPAAGVGCRRRVLPAS